MIRRTRRKGIVSTEYVWNGEEAKVMGHRAAYKTLWEIGLIVEAQAKLLCPVDTGRLRNSITTQTADKGTDVEAPATEDDKITHPGGSFDVYVGTNVDYAPYVEYGTRNTNAQAYLRPAYDLAMGKTLTIWRENARQEFREYMT